jgi:hypothetical protein
MDVWKKLNVAFLLAKVNLLNAKFLTGHSKSVNIKGIMPGCTREPVDSKENYEQIVIH